MKVGWGYGWDIGLKLGVVEYGIIENVGLMWLVYSIWNFDIVIE